MDFFPREIPIDFFFGVEITFFRGDFDVADPEVEADALAEINDNRDLLEDEVIPEDVEGSLSKQRFRLTFRRAMRFEDVDLAEGMG